MIKLSDVKVRLQYRLRVRQRLMALHFARLQGSRMAGHRFGVSARTIRRWQARWRQDALQGLVPRYPRRRGRRITPHVVELIGQAVANSRTAPSGLSFGFAAFTMSVSQSAPSSGSFATSACRGCGGRASGCHDR